MQSKKLMNAKRTFIYAAFAVFLVLALIGKAYISFHSLFRDDSIQTEEAETKVCENKISVTDCSGIVKPPLENADPKSFYGKNEYAAEGGRSRYRLGTSKEFFGEITVVLFFMDDDESAWTNDEIDLFTQKRILPALEFLQEQAAEWGRELKFHVLRFTPFPKDQNQMSYDGTVNPDLFDGGSTKDTVSQIGNHFGYCGDLELREALIEQYCPNSNVFPLVLLDKPGTAFARPQTAGPDAF